MRLEALGSVDEARGMYESILAKDETNTVSYIYCLLAKAEPLWLRRWVHEVQVETTKKLIFSPPINASYPCPYPSDPPTPSPSCSHTSIRTIPMPQRGHYSLICIARLGFTARV